MRHMHMHKTKKRLVLVPMQFYTAARPEQTKPPQTLSTINRCLSVRHRNEWAQFAEERNLSHTALSQHPRGATGAMGFTPGKTGTQTKEHDLTPSVLPLDAVAPIVHWYNCQNVALIGKCCRAQVTVHVSDEERVDSNVTALLQVRE